MSRSERWFNILLGLSVLGWALGSLVAGEKPVPVRIAVALLHMVVGVCVLLRSPVVENGASAQLAMAIPAVLIGGLAFVLIGDEVSWLVSALMIAGSVIACVSFVYLGSSFAILPARRSIKVNGPYRFVRHPAYLGELIMIVACCLASANFWGWVFVPVAVLLIVMRIVAEEDLLNADLAYQEYANRVGYRLVPFVW